MKKSLRLDDSVVYFIDQNGEIKSAARNELIERFAETTTSPRGVEAKIHVRDNELWTWGHQGSFPKLISTHETEDEALDAQWDTFEYDFYNDSEAPMIFDNYQAAEEYKRKLSDE